MYQHINQVSIEQYYAESASQYLSVLQLSAKISIVTHKNVGSFSFSFYAPLWRVRITAQ